jgi:uncharacterized protein YbjT (DUF2867 family)
VKVLVTGGTGVLGREVVDRLYGRGAEEVRVMSRQPGEGHVRGDLETPDEALRSAVAGVDVIAHCATGANWRRPQTDVIQTRNLLAAIGDARPHIVFISIVGVDQIHLGYYRAKTISERLIAASGLPWTILRATQFHELVLMLAMMLSKGPVAFAPRGMRSQPVDVGEVADRLTDLVLGNPVGRARDLGGPRVEELSEAIGAYLVATGKRKPLLEVPTFGRVAGEFRAGRHLPGPHADLGERTFSEFLRERVAEGTATTAPYVLADR